MRRTSYRVCRRGAGPADLEARWEQHAEAGRWALPGALQVPPGFGLDLWVADAFGGEANRVTPYATSR